MWLVILSIFLLIFFLGTINIFGGIFFDIMYLVFFVFTIPFRIIWFVLRKGMDLIGGIGPFFLIGIVICFLIYLVVSNI